MIEDERRAAVRTRASGGIIRSQVLCSDNERRTVECVSVLRAGTACRTEQQGIVREREAQEEDERVVAG